MRCRLCLFLASTFIVFLAFWPSGSVYGASGYRISSPVIYQNLAIYLIHGRSVAGKVPLTLQEALASGAVKLHETGDVNQLQIENLGDDEIFVQSGNLVKGGQQDRVLTVSLILPPRSGKIPIASFCVEQGRWSARGSEDVRQFSSADLALPSREAKIAMKAPRTAMESSSVSGVVNQTNETGERQADVWDIVRSTQQKLARSLGTVLVASQSPSSLQLTLENENLKSAQAEYIGKLLPAGEKDDDVIGFAFAINGKLNSADIYPSNGLFRKLWPQLLKASAIEAIGEKVGNSIEKLPSTELVMAFLNDAERGKASSRKLTQHVKLKTRDGEKTLYFETARSEGGWVHRNYLVR